MSKERTYMLSASELESLINFCLWLKEWMQGYDEHECVCDLESVTVGDIGVALRTRGELGSNYSDLRLDHYVAAHFPGSVDRIQLNSFAKSVSESIIAKYRTTQESPQ